MELHDYLHSHMYTKLCDRKYIFAIHIPAVISASYQTQNETIGDYLSYKESCVFLHSCAVLHPFQDCVRQCVCTTSTLLSSMCTYDFEFYITENLYL